MKDLILIEGNKKYQCENEEELVKLLIDKNFYELPEEDKMKKMKLKAVANSINKNIELVDAENIKVGESIDKNKFVVLDEKTYILSLLMINKVILFESVDSNIYTKYLDKSKFTKNYIVLNKFASEILNKYLDEKGC